MSPFNLFRRRSRAAISPSSTADSSTVPAEFRSAALDFLSSRGFYESPIKALVTSASQRKALEMVRLQDGLRWITRRRLAGPEFQVLELE